ncbi:MAG: thiamine phosphate synthase [Gemmatimonadetes bacterium]|nr:thiamine phosphate synthase [Gemmatimonadota bacterium]
MNALPRLHFVTDDAVLADRAFPDVAERVLECCGRSAALHVRGHATSGARMHAVAQRLQAAALRTGAWLLVNDRLDIARAVRANGVQLGAQSLAVADARALLGAGARIGRSVHGAAEALEAEADGADFVLLGTIFASASHMGRAGAGVGLVQDTVGRTTLPVLAIGGITNARVADVAAAGAYGVAVLGGVWRDDDPVRAAAAYAGTVNSVWPMYRT